MNNKKPQFEFPEETISEILKRLPPKNLGRFKTVCKPWVSIIQSSFFANNIHLTQMKKENNYVFIFQAEYGKHPLVYEAASEGSKVYKRAVDEGDNPIELLVSCNSIILFCNLDDVHFLGNPITTKTIVVPNCQIEFPQDSKFVQVFYGVGFGQIYEGYKVVRIAYFNNDDRGNKVHIFSTKDVSWRRIQEFPFQLILADPGVFAHGYLHWKVYRDSRVYDIARLNCQTETYDLIPIPDDVPTHFIFLDLASLDDDTQILFYHFCKLFETWHFWIQTDYKVHDSWMKIEIEIGTDVAPDNDLFGFQPLCWVDAEKDKILLRKNPHGTFFTYHLKEGIFQDFASPDNEEGFATVFRVVNSIGGPFV